MLQTIIDATLGGILGSIVTIAYTGFVRYREVSATRGQLVFLLRQLQIHMGMIRDFPKYYFYDMRPIVERLEGLSLATSGISGLSNGEREAMFTALYQANQEASFLATDRQKVLDSGELEYIEASARRAFARLQAAREALGDSGILLRPTDPRTLHTWRGGEPIPGTKID